MEQITGEGFVVERQEKKLVITIDTEREGVDSKSGKTKVIASSRGALKVGDVSINLNVYRKV